MSSVVAIEADGLSAMEFFIALARLVPMVRCIDPHCMSFLPRLPHPLSRQHLLLLLLRNAMLHCAVLCLAPLLLQVVQGGTIVIRSTTPVLHSHALQAFRAVHGIAEDPVVRATQAVLRPLHLHNPPDLLYLLHLPLWLLLLCLHRLGVRILSGWRGAW